MILAGWSLLIHLWITVFTVGSQSLRNSYISLSRLKDANDLVSHLLLNVFSSWQDTLLFAYLMLSDGFFLGHFLIIEDCQPSALGVAGVCSGENTFMEH